jgi:hypothetical protein
MRPAGSSLFGPETQRGACSVALSSAPGGRRRGNAATHQCGPARPPITECVFGFAEELAGTVVGPSRQCLDNPF